ncbi:AAA family ATPase [Sphingobium sp. H39-3-25]|uniref:AAA family ATPase n=1 Tax=Sphingobium arseniciresistens TaxID=3030834 RepID=UPI0023B9CE7C|nr:AAA family ATPase [Sphingobium arseniciresistens]
MSLHVVTGGPGSGKSTLIEALGRLGHRTVPESGRAIIRAQMACAGFALPWNDAEAYARAMEAADRDALLGARGGSQPTFFDRGLPDVIGYRRLSNLPVSAEITRDCLDLRYDDGVFLAPPWPEIYGQDSERRQDLAEAIRTYEMMRLVYGELGYTPVVLPKAPVEERIAFVLAEIESSGAPH